MKKSIILCLSILMIALTGCNENENTWGKLAEGAVSMKVGETKQLTFTSDGNVKPQWTSEDETIATVDENGKVTAVRVGTVAITVNGLSCNVTVTDDYMDVVEPMQDWMAELEDVNTYMTSKFGNTAMIDIEYDTAMVIDEITVDTNYVPTGDPEVFDTIITSDTAWREIPYVTMASFEYEATLAGQFADKYVYTFEFDEESETSYIRIATMTVNAAHTGEIETFLNNRYVNNNGSYKAVNQWYYYSYIENLNPDIVYSASKIEK